MRIEHQFSGLTSQPAIGRQSEAIIVGFIKRLLGIGSDNGEKPHGSRADDIEDISLGPRQTKASQSYFDSLIQLQEAISKQDYGAAATLARRNLEYVPDWVKETRRLYRSFDIQTIPVLQQGGTILALVGDEHGIARITDLVTTIPELKPWVGKIKHHQLDIRRFKAIREAVLTNPNCRQTDVKGLIGEKDGRRVAVLISYLEKAGEIVRIKDGRTFRLVLSSSPGAPIELPKRPVNSHRSDLKPQDLIEIDIPSLSYVPLPRAPSKWEKKHVASESLVAPKRENHFETRDSNWRLGPTEKIPLLERPDPAFRQIHPTDSGLFMIDDLGNAEGHGEIEAAALRYDRAGRLAAKAGLMHGTYRVGVHTLGNGLIAMSQDCVAHSYDDDLEMVFETSLEKAPEITAIRRRLGFSKDELKNHIRCVALSQACERYLFTVVDEAWCVDANGVGLWGAKLPITEGWKQIATPSSSFGTSSEVERALSFMGLSLPIGPEDVKRRYRELAKQYHPDLNPADSQAEERMKELNLATELLTGVESNDLSEYAGATFYRELSRTEQRTGDLEFTATIGIEVSEIQASDWIYAASFAAKSNSVYLAGYSGRVILVDENGRGVRVYDIGNVPRRIIDTGDYLYLLTDTRLYVLRDDTLHALIDTFDGGDLIIAQTGFGLLEKKRLRWFREDGHYIGSIVSSDPIRRVYSTDEGTVVETRQRRTIVQGFPKWWEE